MPESTRYTLVIEAPLVDGQPAALRVRRALKSLSRSYKLKCVSIIEVKEKTVAEEVGHLSGRCSKQTPASQRKADDKFIQQ